MISTQQGLGHNNALDSLLFQHERVFGSMGQEPIGHGSEHHNTHEGSDAEIKSGTASNSKRKHVIDLDSSSVSCDSDSQKDLSEDEDEQDQRGKGDNEKNSINFQPTLEEDSEVDNNGIESFQIG